MMLKMMNPFGSLPTVGGAGDSSVESKEEAIEAERMRLEAVRQSERERREKYRRQEEEREQIRQAIREKYGIEKPVRDMDYDDCEEDYEADEDSRTQTTQEKSFAERQITEARLIAEEKCVLQ